MRDGERERPHVERLAQRLGDFRRRRPPLLARFDAGDAADLVIVDDQQIEMRQAGAAEAGRPRARGSRPFPGLSASPAARARRSTVAQPVESSRQGASIVTCAPGRPRCSSRALDAGEIEMLGRHQRGDAGRVDMGAPAAGLGIEAIRAGREPAARQRQPGALNPVAVALVEQEPSVAVVADQAHGGDRQGRIEPLEVDRHVAAGAAALPVDLDDGGHRVLGRPDGNRLVEVDAPGAGGQNATSPAHRVTPPSAPLP